MYKRQKLGMDPGWNGGVVTVIALCLMLGAAGKSAQLPLYIWLPDAMEGDVYKRQDHRHRAACDPDGRGGLRRGGFGAQRRDAAVFLSLIHI